MYDSGYLGETVWSNQLCDWDAAKQTKETGQTLKG